ncbi:MULTISPECIES: glycoside hydrolase family 73 protein [unclassified Clostridioides]|uniref:glycoside hydrolase family 73 protein n=1 Tax=unclassified Clostridioides TaxID=2635829 RepID=UPI001D10C204|nr:glucosaminidase domain-containing protein [Clostridioides sp. ES-S-0171-01]MCC0689958.1 glucosaminidase domain-containing protein [Clostridioides sp. ES-S-0056-01]MCC0716964.1 glucosaminidase domain-containing protein [Clostridioides sp. ES-S-0077-01]UDN55531.1 glucosaminidase domain-containing protein [Clostridioides sp. ES-S-0054-01]
MARKLIKNLGKSKSVKRVKLLFKKVFITVFIVASIVAIFNITKYFEELYKVRDLKSTKIEYYMDVADEAGDGKVQLSWKALLAIDMVIHDEDLSNIKKKDTLDIGEKFIGEDKNDKGEKVYKVKKFNKVLSELRFDSSQKSRARKYMKDLEYTYLGDKQLNSSDEKIKFIKKLEDSAIREYIDYGILPSITIGQAILESGWGNSKLTKQSNNLFGIKADKAWKGKSVEISTSEHYNEKVVASFRSYNSLQDSVKDHSLFLVNNKRYRKHGLFEAKDYISQAQALENAGYSTAEDKKGNRIYSELLIEVIRSYNLQLIDNKVETK